MHPLASRDAPSADRLITPAFALVIAMQMASGFSSSVFLLLPKFLAVDLHAGPGRIGLVSAIPSLTAVFAVPFVGRWIDRVGRKPLIVCGTALGTSYAIGFLSVVDVGPYLFALQVLHGCAFVLQFNASATYVTDLAPASRMSQAIGLFGASNVAMNGIAPWVAERLAHAHGWRAAFLASAIAGVLAFVLALSLRDAPRAKDAPGEVPAPDASHRLARHVLTMAATGAAFAIVFSFYQPLAIERGATEVGAFFLGYAAAVVFVRVGFGGVADRFGRRRVALVAMCLYAVVILSMVWLGPTTLLLFGALFGLAHGTFYPAMNALAVEGVPPSARGRAMTWVNGGFQIGFATSAYFAGRIAEAAGYPAVFVVSAVIAAAGAALIAHEAVRAPVRGAPHAGGGV